MNLRDLIVKARSYRRFREDRKVSLETLTEIVDALRFVPSSVNLQPLRYAISVSPEVNDRIFPHLAWARKLKDWKGPGPGERPSAYVIIGGEEDNTHLAVDLGIACQTLFLAMAEAGLAGCMIGNLDAKAVHGIVGFPGHVKVLQVMAVGYPGETVVVDDMNPGDATDYYRDAAGVHHVPKRCLDEALVKRFA